MNDQESILIPFKNITKLDYLNHINSCCESYLTNDTIEYDYNNWENEEYENELIKIIENFKNKNKETSNNHHHHNDCCNNNNCNSNTESNSCDYACPFLNCLVEGFNEQTLASHLLECHQNDQHLKSIYIVCPLCTEDDNNRHDGNLINHIKNNHM